MYYYMHDPQTENGHFCEICKTEFFGKGDICQRCRSRMDTEGGDEE